MTDRPAAGTVVVLSPGARPIRLGGMPDVLTVPTAFRVVEHSGTAVIVSLVDDPAARYQLDITELADWQGRIRSRHRHPGPPDSWRQAVRFTAPKHLDDVVTIRGTLARELAEDLLKDKRVSDWPAAREFIVSIQEQTKE